MSLEQRAELRVLKSQPGPVLCAVSGGADSMALLHLLWSHREATGCPVCAAHYEHGLRGEESLRDAAFVENWCAARGIPCVVEHGDVAAYGMAHGMGHEEAARRLRYAFLERAARALDCAWIATAHTADDNAETVLLNLCRGAGSLGLGGIPPRRGNILRPLLGCTRAEVEEYLRENAVPHVEDSTNAGDAYRRNRLRHEVLPVLRELNPAFAETAGRAARLLREDDECLRAMAADFIGRYFDGESLPLAPFSALHGAVASRVLRSLCPEALSLAHVEALLALRDGTELAFVDVPGLRVRRERGRLWFSEPAPVLLPERELVPGRGLELPELGLRLEAEVGIYGKEINDLFKTYIFKSENICGKITCTGRKSGDRLRPIGRGCTKTLKALFSEAGYTQAQRQRAFVLRDERGVLAVYGLAIAERTAPQAGDRVLRIEIETM